MHRHQELINVIWPITELLHGVYKRAEYGQVILPFVLMRRLDCLLEPTKAQVLRALESRRLETADDEMRDAFLCYTAGDDFTVYNTSRFTFAALANQAPDQLHAGLIEYIAGFSPNVQNLLFDEFWITAHLSRLKDAERLHSVFGRFAAIDLRPEAVSNQEMGGVVEAIIRRTFASTDKSAGGHVTPRDVIRLIVDLLFINDHALLTKPGTLRSIYDPACGTGGTLSIAAERLLELNPEACLDLYGQDVDRESVATCKSNLLLQGQVFDQRYVGNITLGNTLTDDKHVGQRFHYMLCIPPFDLDWKHDEATIRTDGTGRFAAGLPRVSDGQFLFLQHMVAKMRDDAVGARIGIVLNGSPLFFGNVDSGESKIRRWIIEKDWLEAIVVLPKDLFYNTSTQTYVWIVNNRKAPERRGKVQLIDASGERFWRPMRKSLGRKRREIPDAARELIVRIFGEMRDGGAWADVSKIVDNADLGYRCITVADCHVGERCHVRAPLQASSSGGCAPLATRLGAESAESLSRDQVALEVEDIVSGGMDAEETLSRTS